MLDDIPLSVVDGFYVYFSHKNSRFLRRLFHCKDRLPWRSNDQSLSSLSNQHLIYLLFNHFVDCGGSLSSIVLETEQHYWRQSIGNNISSSLTSRRWLWIHQFEANVTDNIALAIGSCSRSHALSLAILVIISAYEKSHAESQRLLYEELDEATLRLAISYSICILGRETLNLACQLDLFNNS